MVTQEFVPTFMANRAMYIAVAVLGLVVAGSVLRFSGSHMLGAVQAVPQEAVATELYVIGAPYVGSSTADGAAVSVSFGITNKHHEGHLYNIVGVLRTGATSTLAFERREYLGAGDMLEMSEAFRVPTQATSTLSVTLPEEGNILRMRILPPG